MAKKRIGEVVGEVVDHVGISRSRAAEGFLGVQCRSCFVWSSPAGKSYVARETNAHAYELSLFYVDA